MTPNEMLMDLSRVWKAVVEKYPEAEHEKILEHIEALQLLIFILAS